jgi:Domain of unknown function (DUF5666)
MHSMRRRVFTVLFFMTGVMARQVFLTPCYASFIPEDPTQQAAPQTPVAKQAGVVKAINGNTITLTTDAGSDVSVQVLSTAKMVRVAPGQTDLKSATPIQLTDLQVGDRVLVRGQFSADTKSFTAAGLIAMSRSDVEAKKQHDREDWQKRGIGGLVTAVGPSTETITISVAAVGGTKTIAIHTTKSTVLRRYAPGSIQFDDATTAPLEQIRPGDQLRARGTRSADGSEFAAEEVVSGSFRNIAGTITSIDASSNMMNVMDLITKKPFVVKITDQSQVRKLPPEVAQRIAYRLKGTAGASPNGTAAANGAGAGGAVTSSSSDSASPNGGGQRQGGTAGNGRPGGGQADFQQIVNRMPPAAIADFKKDDAVMIVATEGTAPGQVTAITVLGGVEPILAAAPAGSQAMSLSPWSLGGAPAMAGVDANQ